MSPEYSLEGLMLKMKLQCFGHLMRRTDSFEKTLILGTDPFRLHSSEQHGAVSTWSVATTHHQAAQDGGEVDPAS